MSDRIRNGIDADLEAQADAILRQSFLDNPDPEEKAKILTPYMLQNRLKREVFVPGGTPTEPSARAASTGPSTASTPTSTQQRASPGRSTESR